MSGDGEKQTCGDKKTRSLPAVVHFLPRTRRSHVFQHGEETRGGGGSIHPPAAGGLLPTWFKAAHAGAGLGRFQREGTAQRARIAARDNISNIP